MRHSEFTVGDLVEVRSKEEILSTLDKDGRLDGLPFMPQMFQYCGKQLPVFKRAHKTCDTVFPVRSRWMANAVHLETRCDGQAYGGCQASCLLFWKDAWLKRVGPTGNKASTQPVSTAGHAGCTERDVLAGTRKPEQAAEANPVYVCQATQVPYATTPLSAWDPRQYWEDYTSGNTGAWTLFKGAIFGVYYSLTEAGIGVGRIMRWFYNTFHTVWGGTAFPWNRGTIPPNSPTPSMTLNLQPGELVRVKSHEDILKTVTTERKNRGMYFDADQVPYCGGEYRVMKRVGTIIDEKTGKLMKLKNEAIVLDDVYCRSRYSYCRMHCPRAIYSYWREIWLERVSDPANAPAPKGNQSGPSAPK